MHGFSVLFQSGHIYLQNVRIFPAEFWGKLFLLQHGIFRSVRNDSSAIRVTSFVYGSDVLSEERKTTEDIQNRQFQVREQLKQVFFATFKSKIEL